jgi:hypothetical protein
MIAPGVRTSFGTRWRELARSTGGGFVATGWGGRDGWVGGAGGAGGAGADGRGGVTEAGAAGGREGVIGMGAAGGREGVVDPCGDAAAGGREGVLAARGGTDVMWTPPTMPLRSGSEIKRNGGP